MSQNTIPALIEAYNADTHEYHAMHDELERLRSREALLEEQLKHANRINSELTAKNDELSEVVLEQSKVLKKQGETLKDLNGRHQAVIQVSNDKIGGLQAENDTLRNEVRELKRLNPKKLEKIAKEQKAKLAAHTKTITRLEGELRNERRVTQGLRNQLEEQKIGFWQKGQERIVPFLSADVIQRRDLISQASVQVAAWWQHECGLKILCGYDPETDEVYMCNPSDGEGNMIEPTAVAQKVMLDHFRKLHKQGKNK